MDKKWIWNKKYFLVKVKNKILHKKEIVLYISYLKNGISDKDFIILYTFCHKHIILRFSRNNKEQRYNMLKL